MNVHKLVVRAWVFVQNVSSMELMWLTVDVSGYVYDYDYDYDYGCITLSLFFIIALQ